MNSFHISSPARILLTFCLCILCAATVISALPTDGEEQIYDHIIRLHVLAHSDNDDDQAQKLYVRNAVLQTLAATVPSTASIEEAEQILTEMLPRLKDVAEQAAAESGIPRACTVTLTEEPYPQRTYTQNGSCITLPAGVYRSLRIRIGDAVGQNWWCVLFPPLCLSLASEYHPLPDATIPVSADTAADSEDSADDTTQETLLAAGFTPYEITLITGEQKPKTIIKFRIVEFLRNLFR